MITSEQLCPSQWAITHRKVKHAHCTRRVSISHKHTRTRSGSRYVSSSLKVSSCKTTSRRISEKGVSRIIPPWSLLKGIVMVSLVFSTSPAISVRVLPISTTTPTNITNITISTKSTCNIGLLMPALHHNSTSPTGDASKPGTLWYAQPIVDIVQAALDEAVAVLSASHSVDPAKKKGGSSGLNCNVEIEWRDGGWDEKSALGQAVALHMDHKIKVIVGPPGHKCE
ncbi:hypothetical protein PoB_006764800 [Plakobranchus ocellatus]|uniref:Receptor ligand binding region domain-containing protein n=1 Tax=Plakobranchus ocellatus TaxID=259542 RepID=A0AAV4DA57_9GAST|nr:hypothetical protein PoB_006764800 [Plakobranchus ocellatus]